MKPMEFTCICCAASPIHTRHACGDTGNIYDWGQPRLFSGGWKHSPAQLWEEIAERLTQDNRVSKCVEAESTEKKKCPEYWGDSNF